MNKSAFFNYTAAKMNVIALATTVIGLVATFLAKVTASAMGIKASESIMGYYGPFMIVLFVATGIVLFLKKDHSALILAVVNAIFCIFKLIQELSSSESAYGIEVKVSVNFGYWLMVIAAIATVVVLLLPVFTKKNTQQPYGM